ncbi:MAG: hypothetical protein ACU0B9_07485 [Limimaricola soesokkakensis]|uniref:hypothetical protein n=1 Tax=Limimaricola soesokkakensis TaxID=1343159 RepID=UPI004059671C
MRIIFHIGLPKCASSTIQGHFAENDAYYRQLGVLYPLKHRLPKGYQNHNPLAEPDLTPETAVTDLLWEAEQAHCDRILISTERFSTDRNHRLGALATEFCQQLGEGSVSYLAFVREPVAMLRSSYHQFIRAGLWGIMRERFYQKTDCSIEAYIEAFRQARGCNWYEYERLISRALEGTPAGRLYVARSDTSPGPVQSVCDLLEVAAGPATPNRNERLSPAKIKLLREFQRHFGQALYEKNKRPLLNRIDLSDASYSDGEALKDGIDMSEALLRQAFPDMEEHFQLALKMQRTN